MFEFEGLTLVDCLPLIAKYRDTRDAKIFSTLLAKFDMLLLRSVYQLRKKYEQIRDEELQELYHLAIIGMSKALLKIPRHEVPRKIPMWICAYVEAAIVKAYRYKLRDNEYLVAEPYEDVERSKVKTLAEFSRFVAHVDIEDLLNYSLLSEREVNCIRRILLDKESYQSVADSFKVSDVSIWKWLKSGLAKLGELVGKGSDRT